MIPAPGSSSGTSISVSGLGGITQSVTVEISGLSYAQGENSSQGLVLVGPTGAALVLQGGCGIGSTVTDINIAYSDAAAGSLPNFGSIASGTYKPTQYEPMNSLDAVPFPSPGPGTAFSSPAPDGTSTLLTTFAGFNPNGTWSLYAADGNLGDSGEIANGWSLTVTAVPEPSTVSLIAAAGVFLACRWGSRKAGWTYRRLEGRNLRRGWISRDWHDNCWLLCTGVDNAGNGRRLSARPGDAPQALPAEGRPAPALQCVINCCTH